MKIYFNVCNKYSKSKNPKISCIFQKTLVISLGYGQCGREYKKHLKKKNHLKY